MDDDRLRASLQSDPLLRLVALAGHVTSQRFGRVMGRQHGLTPAGSAVLGVLSGQTPPRTTHADLARRCLIAPATLTGVIDTLEKAGYVRRERDEHDRRVVWLVATDAGRARINEVGQQVNEVFVPTKVEREPEKEAVVREFLIELIMQNREAVDDCEPTGRDNDNRRRRRRGPRTR